jgi:molecular chaperone GrpE
MNKRVKVPIRVKSSGISKPTSPTDSPSISEIAPPMTGREPEKGGEGQQEINRGGQDIENRKRAAEGKRQEAVQEDDVDAWRDRALRLQAEMENFRKRQRRLAEERIAEERERLLRSFLAVADDLERALSADNADIESLRRGVALTYQGLMRRLEQEGVKPIRAKGEHFDPTWHEAVGVASLPFIRVGTVPHRDGAGQRRSHTLPSTRKGTATLTSEAEPGTVVKVVQPGYRLGDRLLRPARVIVSN